MITFEEFPKIPRLKRECVITEKIDGTNAQVVITEDGEIGACSRTRVITPGKDTDNFGFAAWVQDNREELLKMGPGRHFGEWYGAGIQRTYGLTERRFALFNTARWNPQNPNKPACCEVVPILFVGALGDADQALQDLEKNGSKAVPGFMRPEGVVVYHAASRNLFKAVIENDDVPKGLADKVRVPRDPNKGGRRVGLTPGYAGPERRAA